MITAEEFARMPDPLDGSRQELVRGVIETMPPAGALHGRCCARLALRVGIVIEDQGLGHVCINCTGFILERDPDTVRGPDVSFWSKDRLPVVPEGYTEVPPDLAVEVGDLNDTYIGLVKKVFEYLNKGVRLIWVVDPFNRLLSVYRSLEDISVLDETDTLEGGDVVPGFSCRVAELFP